MNWNWEEPDLTMCTVWVNWKSGAAKRVVPFWMTDKAIIREVQKLLPWVSGQMTVDRT